MFEKIFSVNNQGYHKIIFFMGMRIKFRRRIKDILPHVNKKKTAKQIAIFKEYGINRLKRTPRLIVSLTSFPQRIGEIHYTLYSLLNQTVKPDAVILWLAEDEFPNKEKDIPDKVLYLKKNGLQIKWCANLRSYKKLIPALSLYPDDIIVTADDDIFYAEDWLEILYRSYQQCPNAIHCHRGYYVELDKDGYPKKYNTWKLLDFALLSRRVFFTGCGGVLYPPKCLDDEVKNVTSFTKLAPYADDVWFWLMAVKKGTEIKKVDGNKYIVYVNPERELNLNGEFTLFSINRTENGNDAQLENVLNAYPQIRENLFLEAVR